MSEGPATKKLEFIPLLYGYVAQTDQAYMLRSSVERHTFWATAPRLVTSSKLVTSPTKSYNVSQIQRYSHTDDFLLLGCPVV